MAYRDIPHDIRVKSTKEVVLLNPDIDEIAENYGVSVSFLKRQFEKVHDNIEETIEKDMSGPKSFKRQKVEVIKETKNNDENTQEESTSTSQE